MTKATPKIVDATLEYMQFIIVDDSITKDMLVDTDTLVKALKSGAVLRVRHNQKIDVYADTDTTLYRYSATSGSGDNKVTIDKYAVAIADAKRAERASAKAIADAMLADIASGMSVAELQAKYQK